MTLHDHEAIRRAYPDTAIIIDGTDSNAGVYKTDGTKFTPVQSNVDTARTAIDNEKAAVAYKDDRRVGFGETSRFIGYGSISEQLDQLYHDVESGKFGADAKTGSWYVGITSIKTRLPKPS